MNGYTGAVLHPLHEELNDLRAEAVRWISGGATLVALGIVWVWALSADVTGLQDVLVAAILLGSAVLAWFMVTQTYVGAAATLITGLVISIATAAVLWSDGQLVYALPLVLFVAPLLMGYWQTFLFGIGEIALVAVLEAQRLTPLPGSDVTIALLLIVISGGLSLVAYQPVRRMLDWTWASFQEERRITHEARERQAELAGLSKSLEEACARLEHANLALAEARRAAEEARRLKDEFATAISHELRTPINLIIGFSEMIVNDPDNDVSSGLRGDVETIYRNAYHLSTLVDDVLDLGRLDAQRLALDKKWSSLPALVHDAVQVAKGLYDKAGLWVEVDLPPDLPVLYIDPTRIRQVLINLLTNAVRYVEAGGVRISARGGGGEVVVSVADSGVGILPDDLPYVFERFQQTGQVRRRGGFGLGLTVSKQLVEMHAGSMWVTSEVNQGTTFWFSLPVVANVAARVANPRLQLLEGQHLGASDQRTVLVVGQDADALRVFHRYLDGYHVRTASTEREVRAVGRKSVVNAVLVANSCANEVGQAIRESFHGVPVLHCSLQTITRASRKLGVAAFLTKPVTGNQLKRILRQLRLRPRRALVVDDDPDMVRLLARMLNLTVPRCHVQTATSAAQGLTLVRGSRRAERPDLVMLDLLMPDMDGRAFIESWRADPSVCDIPIVVVSAASEEDHDLVVAESVEIRRDGGLSVADLMRIVRGSLDRLLHAVPASRPLEDEATAPAPVANGDLSRS